MQNVGEGNHTCSNSIYFNQRDLLLNLPRSCLVIRELGSIITESYKHKMLELRWKNVEKDVLVMDFLRVTMVCPASHGLESWDQETSRVLVQICLKEANHVFEMSSWLEWNK